MRHHRWIPPTVTAIGLLALALTTAQAQPGPRRFDGAPPGQGPGPEMMLDRMVERLGLSPEQETAVREIFTAHHAEMEPLHEQMQTAQQTVREQVQTEPVDEAAIRDAVLAAAQVEADIEVARAQLNQRLHTELTDEQWAEWQQLQTRFRGGMGPRGHRHGGFGPAPGRRGSR